MMNETGVETSSRKKRGQPVTRLTIEVPEDTPGDLLQLMEGVAKASSTLATRGLNRRGVVTLLVDSTGLSDGTIEKVLNAIEALPRKYGNQPPKGANG